ncbi:MAG: alpha/beta hydrolase family protein [Gemmatimonadales bacterium]
MTSCGGPTLILLLMFVAPLAAQTKTIDWIPTRFVEGGEPVRLEAVIYRPDGEGPFPTLLFNHGSTGNGRDTTLFRQTAEFATIARYFTERGWLVVVPQRRGRGKSGGRYGEGVRYDGTGYTCNVDTTLAGFEHALADLDEVVRYLAARPDVDTARMLIGGQSRGGILSVGYAGTRPGRFDGVINFVGGWMSDRCPNPAAINTATFRRGAASGVPTLWLYGEGDPFYGLEHSRSNFDAFVAAGGDGEWWQVAPAAGTNGHQIIRTPALWAEAVAGLMAKVEARRRGR